ncbi:MAG: TIGR03087 family PEP-CTERM/XrtA system glycosyltransferase [Bryobacteraceae bacterium]|jgi:sugar transferase (PEP-CTERM/EpsH1 system associated)
MDILFASHCVPNPPNKGEKIRAFHSINALCRDFRVHLVCFARDAEEIAAARELSDRCASVYAHPVSAAALPAAAVRFALGGCLNFAFFSSRRLRQRVDDLARRVPLRAGVGFTAVMAPYVPSHVPRILDMVDVDSEKWRQYAESRRPALPYRIEAKRLRQEEIRWARSSVQTVFSTRNEEELFQSFAPDIPTAYMENGVDFEYFDPARTPVVEDLARRRYVVFTGTMDYWPNIDAVQWFATRVLPELRRQSPEMEFFIAGRNPKKQVAALGGLPGVHVTGAVTDIRVYLKHAQAVVIPLRIARGIQNKVLEALAMGKPVLGSAAVCRTFGSEVPPGVIACDSEQAYVQRLSAGQRIADAPAIRQALVRRFDWSTNLRVLRDAVADAAATKAY